MFRAERWRGAEPWWRGLVGTVLLLALWRPDEPLPSPSAPLDALAVPPAPEQPKPPSPPPAPDPRDDVLWGGCEEVKLSPEGEPTTCTLFSDVSRERATLRVWLPSSVSAPAVSIDGTAVTELHDQRVHGGWSLHVVPDHGGHLRVSGTVDGVPRELLSFDIDLRPRPDADLRAQLEAAQDEPRALRALAQRLRAELAGELSPPQRLMTTQYLQYVSFDLGEHRDAVGYALEVARQARARDEPLAECHALGSASFVLGEKLGEVHAAEELLRGGCPHRKAILVADMMGSYYDGLRMMRQGHLSAAQRSFDRSLRVAHRIRWPRWELTVLNPLIETLARQGRFGWARRSLERMRELDTPSHNVSVLEHCVTQVSHHRKLGSLAQREAELHGESLARAREHWLAALEVVRDRSRCPEHPSIHDNAQRIEVDLARAAVEAGELEHAQALLDGLPLETIAIGTDASRRLARAELALARGQASAAARILEDLAADRRRGRLADAMGPEEDWRLHLAWARVHQQRGELAAALASLAEAQGHIDRGRGPSGVESDRPAAMRRKSSELLVRLLLDHGQPRQALCAARVARARGLLALAPLPGGARESLLELERTRAELFEDYKWYDPRDIPVDQRLELDAERRSLELDLSEPLEPIECDQLPSAVPGEASLLYVHDGPSTIGFAWNAEGRLVVRRLSHWPAGRPPESLGEALISPFAPVLEGATRLRVLAPASMGEVSFAELPWQGRPLGDRLAVVYALDLRVVPTQIRHEGTAALVFADPHMALMSRHASLAARFEQWRATLEAHGLRVSFEAGPSVVSVPEILQGTRGVDLALLYGFGAVAPSSYAPWPERSRHHDPDQDGLGVGADVLTRADVLLEAGMVPRRVILAHCDSAVVDAYGVSGAIGLAQSYVQAGAQWAIGVIGEVSPESMEAVVDALVEGLPPAGSVDEVAMALQIVTQRLRRRGISDATQLRLWAR